MVMTGVVGATGNLHQRQPERGLLQTGGSRRKAELKLAVSDRLGSANGTGALGDVDIQPRLRPVAVGLRDKGDEVRPFGHPGQRKGDIALLRDRRACEPSGNDSLCRRAHHIASRRPWRPRTDLPRVGHVILRRRVNASTLTFSKNRANAAVCFAADIKDDKNLNAAGLGHSHRRWPGISRARQVARPVIQRYYMCIARRAH
jgi:hypothetical protein